MKLRIRKYLIQNCKGKQNAITIPNLVYNIGHLFKTDEDRSIRKIVRELIDDGEMLIGSCSKGYFIIQSEEELNDCLKRYGAMVNSVQRRMINLSKIFYRPKQLRRRKK